MRKYADKRLTLYRKCAVCGRPIVTRADSPWARQVAEDGRQLQKYYCSSACYKASYKHIGWYDGLAWKRKIERDKEREKTRNRAEAWSVYYAANGERIREKRRERYRENIASERADNAYYKKHGLNDTYLTACGETRSYAEWERVTGIPRAIIYARVNTHKWSPDRAVTQAVRRVKVKIVEESDYG